MAQQNINYGVAPNDGTGDLYRNAMIKVQNNFTELYGTKVDKTVTIATSGGATGTATAMSGTAVVIPITGLNMGSATAGTLAVARGGTGTTTATGSGANVQAVSPALTGTPTVPTAANTISTTQVASTSFVQNVLQYYGLPFADVEASTSTDLAATGTTNDFNLMTGVRAGGNYVLAGTYVNGPSGASAAYAGVLQVIRRKYDAGAALMQTVYVNSVSMGAVTYTRMGSLVSGAWTFYAWEKVATESSNVASATKLAVARTINLVPFDGTGNIIVQSANEVIPNAADMNTLLTPGTYSCVSATVANTLTNKPPGVNSAFGLVIKATAAVNTNTKRVRQEVTQNHPSRNMPTWIRSGDNGAVAGTEPTWSPWVIQYDADNPQPVNLAATYSATQVTVTNTAGNNAVLNAATAALAGMMSAADKAKSDGQEALATRDWGPGIAIAPDGVDLNTYQTPGAYNCSSNARASTLVNSPTVRAFSLQIYKDAGVTQIITEYGTSGKAGKSFKRGFYSNAWTAWAAYYDEAYPQLVTTTDTAGTSNTNIASTAFVQAATSGTLYKAITGNAATLTAAEASNVYLAFTGTLTANATVTFPNSQRVYLVANYCTGNFTLTLQVAGAAAKHAVPTGKRMLVLADSSGVYPSEDYILGVAQGGTGTATSTGSGDVVLSVSPAMTGEPTVPTAATATNNTQIASTAFVQAVNSADTGSSATAVTLKTARTFAITGGATAAAQTFNGGANVVLNVTALDMSVANAGTLAVARGGTGTTTATGSGANVQAVSPALTGTPTVPTAASTVNNTQAASTAFVKTAVSTPTTATQYRIGAVNTQNVFLATGWTGRDIEWSAAQESNGALAWHSYNNGTYLKPAFILSKDGAAEFGGLLRSNGTINYSTTSACRQEGNIGAGFADWDGAVEPMSQLQCPQATAAYMLWRATHPYVRHLAAMHVHAKNGNTEPAMVAMSISGSNYAKNTNAFIWYGDGDYQVKRNITAGGSITPNSDIRLKNVLSKVRNPMVKLRAIEHIIYTRKDMANGVRYGYSAQSVEAVMPEAIVKTPPAENQKEFVDDEVKSVDYNGVSVLHGAALVEHDDKIIAMQQEIAELKEQVKLLLSKV